MRPVEVAGAIVIGALVMSCSDGRSSARDTSRDTSNVIASPSPASAIPARDSSTPTESPRQTLLFLGTSLTAGLGLDPDSAYPQLIQRKIDASALPYQVVNAGVSGETSASLLRRLDWVLQRSADVIVVETGANDGLRGLPVSATKATIDEVLTRIQRDRPRAKIALVQMEAPPNLGKEYTSAFHEMFGTVARAHGAVLLPFLLDSVAGRPQLNQADGIHPNEIGERIVADNVWRALQPLLAR
jgi:acyl-CoA thioesterase-1